MTKQWRRRIGRLGARHIEHRCTDVTRLDRGDQIVFRCDHRAAADVHKDRAAELREALRVEKPTGRLGVGQYVDDRSTRAEEGR